MANKTTKARILAMIKRRPHTCTEVAKKLAVKGNYAWMYLMRMYERCELNRRLTSDGDIVYYPTDV
jgi:DNA-binding CsgD family transcriptional regulator